LVDFPAAGGYATARPPQGGSAEFRRVAEFQHSRWAGVDSKRNGGPNAHGRVFVFGRPFFMIATLSRRAGPQPRPMSDNRRYQTLTSTSGGRGKGALFHAVGLIK
jgi:hypothetical protein